MLSDVSIPSKAMINTEGKTKIIVINCIPFDPIPFSVLILFV